MVVKVYGEWPNVKASPIAKTLRHKPLDDLYDTAAYIKGKSVNKKKPPEFQLDILKVILVAENAHPEERKSYLPRRCVLSGKFLFFKDAVCIRRDLSRYKEYVWVDAKEWTLFLLTASSTSF